MDFFPHPLSTGFASGRIAAAPLHPWLHPFAPLGLKQRTPEEHGNPPLGLAGRL
jgi:hypothetical protein